MNVERPGHLVHNSPLTVATSHNQLAIGRMEEVGKLFPKPAHIMPHMNGRGRILSSVVILIAILLVLAVYFAALPLLSVPMGDLPRVGYAAIAVDSEENLQIVWADGRDNELFSLDGTFIRTRIYYSKFDSDGEELVKDRPISLGGGRTPLIEVDSKSNVWVAYVLNGTFIVKLDTDGEKVLEKKVLPQMPLSMSLTIGTDENIYLSWLECSQRQCFQYYVVLNDNAESVLGKTNVSQVSPVPGFPVIVGQNGDYVYLDERGGLDGNGNVYVISHFDDYLHFTKIDNGGGVVINNTQIPGTAEWSGRLELKVDSDNQIHITGIVSSGIGYMKLNSTGNVTTSASGIRVGDLGDIQLNPSIDVDSSGNAYIVWNVEEIIREDPYSGSRDFAYSLYCAKIKATGAIQDKWTIVESELQKLDSADLEIRFALVGVLITLLVILLILLVKRRNKRSRESAPIDHERPGS